MSEEPEELTETEARGGSKILDNRNMLIISLVIVVVALVGVFAYFA